ncbi:phosphopantetheine-binding protein [Jatrophihabitans sp.]|jgi:acyl carrier protein|uniref:phosphopantetheine-binding protein n=1 Tax=Jatrophihabitans sp. TaxID=1932789 RepID=UPI002EE36466
MTEQVRQELSGGLAETVARVWAEALGVPEVAPDQGFFELGGHSLTALRVVYTLRAALSVQLSLRELMESCSLAEFTDTVRAACAGAPARPAVPLIGRRGTR